MSGEYVPHSVLKTILERIDTLQAGMQSLSSTHPVPPAAAPPSIGQPPAPPAQHQAGRSPDLSSPPPISSTPPSQRTNSSQSSSLHSTLSGSFGGLGFNAPETFRNGPPGGEFSTARLQGLGQPRAIEGFGGGDGRGPRGFNSYGNRQPSVGPFTSRNAKPVMRSSGFGGGGTNRNGLGPGKGVPKLTRLGKQSKVVLITHRPVVTDRFAWPLNPGRLKELYKVCETDFDYVKHPKIFQSDDAGTVQYKVCEVFRQGFDLEMVGFSWAAPSSDQTVLLHKGNGDELDGTSLHEIFRAEKYAFVYSNAATGEWLFKQKLEERWADLDEDVDDPELRTCDSCEQSFEARHFRSHQNKCSENGRHRATSSSCETKPFPLPSHVSTPTKSDSHLPVIYDLTDSPTHPKTPSPKKKSSSRSRRLASPTPPRPSTIGLPRSTQRSRAAAAYAETLRATNAPVKAESSTADSESEGPRHRRNTRANIRAQSLSREMVTSAPLRLRVGSTDVDLLEEETHGEALEQEFHHFVQGLARQKKDRMRTERADLCVERLEAEMENKAREKAVSTAALPAKVKEDADQLGVQHAGVSSEPEASQGKKKGKGRAIKTGKGNGKASLAPNEDVQG